MSSPSCRTRPTGRLRSASQGEDRMSTTIEHAGGARGVGTLRESNRYRIFVAVVCSVALTTLFLCAVPTSSGFSAVRSNGWDVLLWTLLVGCTSCLPIYSGRGAWLSLDLP